MRAWLFTYPTKSRFVLGVIVATLLAWSLMAAPAFAQDQAKAGDANMLFVDCSQVQTAFAQQYNSGDAISVSQGQYGNAIAVIAQDLDISQSQVNACLGGTPPESTTPETTTPETTTDETTAPETPASETTTGETTAPNGDAGAVDNPDGVIASTIAKGELVNTGGMPLPAAAAGLALVAVGMFLAGMVVRRGR
jgi:hypothetical protein